MPVTAFVGVGSNLGDRQRTIREAQSCMESSSQIRFVKSAPIYETAPMGGKPQGTYLNTVWELETGLTACDVLNRLLRIECDFDRVRHEKNDPRTLDLDLLFFGDSVIHEPGLTVPHPRLHERWFVLKPLWDLRPDWVHPIFKKSICELLDQVSENSPKR